MSVFVCVCACKKCFWEREPSKTRATTTFGGSAAKELLLLLLLLLLSLLLLLCKYQSRLGPSQTKWNVLKCQQFSWFIWPAMSWLCHTDRQQWQQQQQQQEQQQQQRICHKRMIDSYKCHRHLLWGELASWLEKPLLAALATNDYESEYE